MPLEPILQVMPSTNILIIDEDPQVISFYQQLFHPNFTVASAPDAECGYPLLLQREISVLICNEHLRGESGLLFMARISGEFNHLQPVLMSDSITEDLLFFAINEVGVLKYIKKPLIKTDVQVAVSSAYNHYLTSIETAAITVDYVRLKKRIHSIPYIAGRIQQATYSIVNNIRLTTFAASGTIAIVLGVFFSLGVSGLVLLYGLKCLFGLNVFVDNHLIDFF